MVELLKYDSQRWEAEKRSSGTGKGREMLYKNSRTHENRKRYGLQKVPKRTPFFHPSHNALKSKSALETRVGPGSIVHNPSLVYLKRQEREMPTLFQNDVLLFSTQSSTGMLSNLESSYEKGEGSSTFRTKRKNDKDFMIADDDAQ